MIYCTVKQAFKTIKQLKHDGPLEWVPFMELTKTLSQIKLQCIGKFLQFILILCTDMINNNITLTGLQVTWFSRSLSL